MPPSLPPPPRAPTEVCLPTIGAGDCSEFAHCHANASHGVCERGRCVCGPNYAGLSCELAVSCQWWDPLRSFWSTEGCVTLPAAAAGVLNCACHHLTEFGGVAALPIAALPKPPTKTFPTGADAQGDPLDAESTDHGYGNAPNHLVFLVIGAYVCSLRSLTLFIR